MSSYYIVSEQTDNGQTWAVTLQREESTNSYKIVTQVLTHGDEQKWTPHFQVGKNNGGVSFVCNGQAIAYTSNNEPLTAVPFAFDEDGDHTSWNINTNDVKNPWFLVVNPENGWGQIWDIRGGSAGDGNQIGTWNENGGSNQRWKFVEVK